jgi:heme exporter protein A
MSDAAAVDARGLVRAYGARRALAGVDLRVVAGQCLAVFGPNGAGKTTLLRCLAGLSAPTAGVATVNGVRVPGGPALRATVGLISHQTMLYGPLTARENLEFAARCHGVPDPTAAAGLALERLGVADRADTPVRALSRGLQQRVAIARAIVHDPRVLLADEPYTGLDAAGAAAFTAALRERLADGAALVLVTHALDEGLALATEAAVLVAGRIVRTDRVAALDPTRYAAEYRALVAA